LLTLCINIVARIQLVPLLKSVILTAMQTWMEIKATEKEFQGGVLTVGNFDGLHFGHQALLKKCRELAKPVILMTFDPHPLQVLRPDRPHTRIFPRADLMERLPLFGVDLLLILPFTKELASLSAEEFLKKYVADPFAPKHLVAGHDFALGKNREGSLEFLRAWGERQACELHVVEPLARGGEIFSSRRIRELITKGEVERAAEKLGRFFYLKSEVGSGAGRGSGLGVPTMNLKPLKETIPAHGVYASRAWLNGICYGSVTNVGMNPTFGGAEGLKIETHILGASVEARGLTVVVEFVKRLRPEMKFASIEDLKKQIKDDILKAHEALDHIKPGK
jgi:riboflavin kinase/FMN adenylyltransferase